MHADCLHGPLHYLPCIPVGGARGGGEKEGRAGGGSLIKIVAPDLFTHTCLSAGVCALYTHKGTKARAHACARAHTNTYQSASGSTIVTIVCVAAEGVDRGNTLVELGVESLVGSERCNRESDCASRGVGDRAAALCTMG